MKKMLLILLALVALTLYSYNAFLLFRGSFPGARPPVSTKKAPPSFAQLLVAADPSLFVSKGRDPFTLYSEKPKPVQKIETVTVQPLPAKEILPPPLTLTGILWNSSNPVATIRLPDGATKLVKQGQDIGDGTKIKRIDRNSIVVLFEGKEFVIKR